MSLDVLINTPKLPYANKNLVKTKAGELTKYMRSVVPKIGTLINNDGTEFQLIKFEGTIPMMYMGGQYNIPIEIFLSEGFPQNPPRVFVRPTTSMIVKPGHSFVTRDGDVLVSYLKEWKLATPTRSSLVELCNCLMRDFGREPPLFSVTPPPQQSVSQQQPPNTRPMHSPPQSNQQNTFPPQASATVTRTPSADVFSVLPSRPMPPPVASMSAAKQALVEQVTLRMQVELSKVYSAIASEIEKEAEVQSLLVGGASSIDSAVKELRTLDEQIDLADSLVSASEKEFSDWVTDMRSKYSDDDIETRLEPYDELSLQIVKLNAENMAIEDAMFHVEKALESATNGSIDAVTLVRAMRKLAKQQFVCRAHLMKIKEVLSAPK